MNRTRKKEKLILLSFTAVLLVVVGIFWFRQRFTPSIEYEEIALPVSTILPESHRISEALNVPGVLESDHSVLVTPLVSGTLQTVFAEVGDHVEKGDLLAGLDSEAFDLELRGAESAWLLAAGSLSRIESLYGGSGSSLQQLEEARSNNEMASSSYELSSLRRSYADIRSPISGTVLQSYADAGNIAAEGNPLFLVGDAEMCKVTCRIPEKLWEDFSSPETITVVMSRRGRSGDSSVIGSIRRVSPSISPDDLCFEVICILSDPGPDIPIGSAMSVAFLFREESDILSLPIGAVDGKGAVWWVDPEDSRAHRLVLPDLIRDSERTAIPELWAERVFVLNGHHRLREGQLVESFAAISG